LVRDTGMSVREIKKYRKISLEKAIDKFLPKEIRQQIIDDGKYPLTNGTDRDIILDSISIGYDLYYGGYKDYFNHTKKGKKWHAANVLNPDSRETILDSIKSNTVERMVRLEKSQRQTNYRHRNKRYKSSA
ncbi:hypothetical protein ACFL1H_02605, partial [Nanoarchaeota archaeon]